MADRDIPLISDAKAEELDFDTETLQYINGLITLLDQAHTRIEALESRVDKLEKT